MDWKNNFPKLIKDLRLQYGYTQEYVAKTLGITYQSYQSYELGLSLPRLDNIRKLAIMYDVTTDYLLRVSII